MPWSVFRNCDESCGWTAAAVAALCIGSYGVPIKETLQVEVHPLVLQSYKTVVVFFTFSLILLMGEQIRWTNWGLVSGFLWVLGGSVGCYAIRTAGMAIATGTWASVTVMINFIWGILIFHEPIQSFASTCCAFVLLGIGLVGMSRYSDPSASIVNNNNNNNNGKDVLNGSCHADERIELTANSSSHDEEDAVTSGIKAVSSTSSLLSSSKSGRVDRKKAVRKRLLDETPADEGGEVNNNNNNNKMEDGSTSKLPLSSLTHHQQQQQQQDPRALANKDRVVLFGRWALTKRQLGVLAAVGNGILAGSSLIPLHYANADGFGGATYMISFSVGSVIANIIVWSWYYAYTYLTLEQRNYTSSSSSSSNTTSSNNKRWYAAWEALPKWHFSQLWLPGFAAGLLLSIGMFGSITTVTFLGQGIGNSLIQSKILISGLWGICWYKEITARSAIIKWFLSASTAVSGILWLTFEHTTAAAAATVVKPSH